MKIETVNLSHEFPGIPDEGAFMTAYITENTKELHSVPLPAVVIFPGGGYEFTSDREAEPVAIEFVNRGYQCFVLRYSVAPHTYPQALLEGSGAVAYVRRHAAEYNVDPHSIAVMGFSAGGHLAGCVGTKYNDSVVRGALHTAEGESRPDAMVLCYAVLTMHNWTHGGTRRALLGENADPKLVEQLSIEEVVNSDTPPAFLWHTVNDTAVPVQNSLDMASALNRAGVPFELHTYVDGPHGLSLCNQRANSNDGQTKQCYNSRIAGWTGLCDGWLREIFAK
jgi:acetyl esterase/lipase